MVVPDGNIFEEAAREEREDFDRVFGNPEEETADEQPDETPDKQPE